MVPVMTCWCPQYPPSGYGLEATDLCESLFGYRPCLAGEKRRCSNHGQEECADEGGSSTAEGSHPKFLIFFRFFFSFEKI
jgi:hypothetical protein